MKVSDFKLFSTLPEEYEYEIFKHDNDELMIIGKQHNRIIGFVIRDGELIQLQFDRNVNRN